METQWLAARDLGEMRNAIKNSEATLAQLRGRAITGINSEAGQGILSAVDRCATNRQVLKGYEIEFILGALRSDGLREITVQYHYSPFGQWNDRKLRFRCSLAPTRQEHDKIIDASDYEASWAFLPPSADVRALPSDAFTLEEVAVRRGGTFTTYPHTRLRSEHSDHARTVIELETQEELRGLTPDDLVTIRFKVLQADGFRVVNDRVFECVFDYTARCSVGSDATDIVAVFPGSFVSTSAGVVAGTDFGDPRRASVKAAGWVVPQGGTSFSWMTARAAPVATAITGAKIDLQSLGISPQHIKQSLLVHIGTATDAASAVVRRLETAREAWNTYIVGAEPYPKKTREVVEDAITKFIKRDDSRFEETCSFEGKGRVDRIKAVLGAIPDAYAPRVLKASAKSVPACNFIILKHGSESGIPDEIFFGWGYFPGSLNESVFWSKDETLISFFRDYHRALRSDAVSEDYRP